MKSLKLKSTNPWVEFGFGLSFMSFLLGLPGKEDGSGNEAGGNSCGMGCAERSPLLLTPMSVPMLDMLDVKLLSVPLANDSICLGDDLPEAGGSPVIEGNKTRPLSRSAPEPPLSAR